MEGVNICGKNGGGGRPLLGPAFPDSRQIACRESGSMEATQKRAASTHSGHTAAGSSCQQSLSL